MFGLLNDMRMFETILLAGIGGTMATAASVMLKNKSSNIKKAYMLLYAGALFLVAAGLTFFGIVDWTK